jgi:hypothetical protein
VFLPNSIQNHLNMGLDPAFRWVEDGTNLPIIGGHVPGIRLTNGILRTNMDTFIHDETNPMTHVFELANPDVAKSNSKLRPSAATGAKSTKASVFTASQVGTYIYAVAGISRSGAGMSQATFVTGTFAPGTDFGVDISITNPGTNDLGGYAIYRGRLSTKKIVPSNGVTQEMADTETLKDMRLVKIIPVQAGTSTVYTDDGRDIPGTVSVPLLNLAPGADAIGWRQFQPMTKIQLPFGVGGMPVMSWFQFLFGYLRMTKPKHHGYIKNILPSDATWQPFS